ncbi:type IV toxin-antitoxin system AbiEi family antitoxin domain-containing protein [Streptomyces botrytidirepellens]|uniref:AbiEi antitoxin N-terminal domain-containing protein n=1 Tax=Streptomyces botrytidirepellens TaxID=2486417 RepID=A0A3M8WE70_9ACTN|nr:type IV toxin-antitoxin system AbiEi family antitoxin domain-containing protein [Streptomyces botrytidirepellens]RNG27760.1 hypothetical protein EEJ42_13010 [Streptomyces botrytidirepellens]
MDYVERLVRLGRLTTEQWGLVTAEQARQVGVDASALAEFSKAGLLSRAGEGVFQLAGAPLPAHLDIKVAWLRLEPDRLAWHRQSGASGVVSHSSACLMHGLGDLPTGVVEFLTEPGADASRAAGVRFHHVPRMDSGQITLIDGLPVTAVERTIQDLLRAGLDGGHIGGVVADAVRRGLVDRHALASHIAPFAAEYQLPFPAGGFELMDHLLAAAGERFPLSADG